jgi:hypothetical protein
VLEAAPERPTLFYALVNDSVRNWPQLPLKRHFYEIWAFSVENWTKKPVWAK